jgi:hypothetical protein
VRVDRAVQVRFVNSLSPSLALALSHTYTHSLCLYTYKAMLFSLFFMLQSGQFVRPVGCDIAPVPFLPHFSLGFKIFLLLFSRSFFSHRVSVCLQSMLFFLARSLQIMLLVVFLAVLRGHALSPAEVGILASQRKQQVLSCV